jgi:hypothetical protein
MKIPAYYTTKFNTAVKSFKIQAPGAHSRFQCKKSSEFLHCTIKALSWQTSLVTVSSKVSSGLYYRSVMIIIYNHNDSTIIEPLL